MNVSEISIAEYRQVTPGTHPDQQFVTRWSPRAMTGQTPKESDVLSLLEAARWAPSCFNAQPWRFAYALNPSAEFGALLAKGAQQQRKQGKWAPSFKTQNRRFRGCGSAFSGQADHPFLMAR